MNEFELLQNQIFYGIGETALLVLKPLALEFKCKYVYLVANLTSLDSDKFRYQMTSLLLWNIKNIIK